MSETITGVLLSGLTPVEFLIYYVVGIAGIFVRFLYNVTEGVLINPSTPYKFRMKYFVKGLIRLFMSMIVMAFVVARFYEFSHLVVTLASHDDGVNITPGTAFMLGLGIDEVVKRIIGRTIKTKP